MSVEWFEWYTKQLEKTKDRVKFRDRYLCPCCYMPTLDERSVYDICSICFWEDDGQDSDDETDVRGGPNRDYSLAEARRNFEKHSIMYRPEDTPNYTREGKNVLTKQPMYLAYQNALNQNTEQNWKVVISEEKRYHGREI